MNHAGPFPIMAALLQSEAGRIRDLIDQARALLDEGRSRESALVFGSNPSG